MSSKVGRTSLGVSYADGRATIRVPARFGPGRHELVLVAADYQESKNGEDVGPILPNTAMLRATVTVR